MEYPRLQPNWTEGYPPRRQVHFGKDPYQNELGAGGVPFRPIWLQPRVPVLKNRCEICTGLNNASKNSLYESLPVPRSSVKSGSRDPSIENRPMDAPQPSFLIIVRAANHEISRLSDQVASLNGKLARVLERLDQVENFEKINKIQSSIIKGVSPEVLVPFKSQMRALDSFEKSSAAHTETLESKTETALLSQDAGASVTRVSSAAAWSDKEESAGNMSEDSSSARRSSGGNLTPLDEIPAAPLSKLPESQIHANRLCIYYKDDYVDYMNIPKAFADRMVEFSPGCASWVCSLEPSSDLSTVLVSFFRDNQRQRWSQSQLREYCAKYDLGYQMRVVDSVMDAQRGKLFKVELWSGKIETFKPNQVAVRFESESGSMPKRNFSPAKADLIVTPSSPFDPRATHKWNTKSKKTKEGSFYRTAYAFVTGWFDVG